MDSNGLTAEVHAAKKAGIPVIAYDRMLNNSDADLEACQRIVEGTQKMTVYKPIEKLAGKGAECAVALAKKQIVAGEQTISDGTYDIPYITIQPMVVTASNMEATVIQSGFHLREEVYQNMN